ncbi:helix-turn-helix domain-containing protein [Micromonospora sp. NPDC003776]
MASVFAPRPTGPTIGPFPIAGLVRQARRRVGLGQRQMARFARVAPSTIGRVESGELTPSLRVLERIFGAAGLYLALVDQDGRVIQPMDDWEGIRDGAGRRYPSHLKLIIDPEPGEWWADIYGLARPPETFHRCPVHVEERRRRSQWEVRVAKYRATPPPPDPRRWRWSY